MDSGLYAACAGLVARAEALEIHGNNLANVNANGFRMQKPVFSAILAKASRTTLSSINQAVNDYGVLGGTRVDRLQGALDQTGNPLDFAIEGAGFFSVETSSGTRYTRNGNFHLSSTRELLTAGGDRVVGDQGAIRVPNGTLSISADGTISVDGALAGKLKIVEFSAATGLQAEGGGLYFAPNGSAMASPKSALRQGFIEGSNVNPVFAAVDLIATQRHAEMLHRALNAFHGELDKTAVEDLVRA